MSSLVNGFIKRLDTCPAGTAGWRQFETLCLEILEYLFVPSLINHGPQVSSFSGIDRRDAIFANRNLGATTDPLLRNWYTLYLELQARMIVFEFKNYEKETVGKDEVNQTRNYIKKTMGKLAIIITNKPVDDSAKTQRNIVYNQEEKVILFVTKDKLKEMLYMKERGDEPSDLIMQLLEQFYIQHE
ncbi:restriction endonuclease [Pedobacter suwonensis]|uniref:restriction endonuclease n=1 Tax=Pedobacter suwonensis TaxID=332999 RepID=UPI00119D53BA|nr:restriction endonuclease [Pedobacter suwonensis]